MYIQENSSEKQHTVPPDYSGHTYTPPPVMQAPTVSASQQEEAEALVQGEFDADTREAQQPPDASEPHVQAGLFSGKSTASCAPKGGKRGDLFGNLGLGGLFSRVPFLSSLAPPPRRCDGEERKHNEWWDWILLGVVVLCLLNGKDDDVLPLLLLLLLWD